MWALPPQFNPSRLHGVSIGVRHSYKKRCRCDAIHFPVSDTRLAQTGTTGSSRDNGWSVRIRGCPKEDRLRLAWLLASATLWSSRSTRQCLSRAVSDDDENPAKELGYEKTFVNYLCV